MSFGDCLSGIEVKKALRIKNTTQMPLLVELSSDRANEIRFELKGFRDMLRNRNSELNPGNLSPELSPFVNDVQNKVSSARETPTSNSSSSKRIIQSMDSDDDAEENDEDFPDSYYRNSLSKQGMYLDDEQNVEDDIDDDFEFDHAPPKKERLSQVFMCSMF